jgi:hypothetical protein
MVAPPVRGADDPEPADSCGEGRQGRVSFWRRQQSRGSGTDQTEDADPRSAFFLKPSRQEKNRSNQEKPTDKPREVGSGME